MNRLTRVSKFLSYHLRHRPDLLNLKLASGGWVEVDKLLQAAEERNFSLSFGELQRVVEQNGKKRFSFNPQGNLIRANQGHSVAVDLQLKPLNPPDILYHGTHSDAIVAITQQGLKKMSRHHVHLSSDIDTAKSIGTRRGRPIIIAVNSRAMSEAGYLFYRSDNGVWLSETVPSQYLQIDK